MKIKNNYNECLTNLACSIKKYFNLNYNHNTLKCIDDILEENKPQNIVLVLFDGLGSRILDRTLDRDAFLIKNKLKEITSVFPATTTAATTSIRTGLNPIEHGWLGWNTYIKPIDKVITMFLDKEKGKNDICKEYLEIKEKELKSKTISREINEKGEYKSFELFPFSAGDAIVYKNLDEAFEIVLEETKKDGKKFIYLYNDEPDHTMHELGPDSIEAKNLIVERNNKIEALANKLEDTLLIVIADHGHIKVDNIFLNNYPEILELLDRQTSLEQRSISFKIKSGKGKIFEERFNKCFGKYFKLYTKDDVISSGLFGDGRKNELFDAAIGDYIAIAEDSNKAIVTDGDDILYSQHAGYTDDEVYVPLILVKKGK